MAAKSSPVFNDEIKIDIGKYIETLVRQWAWILGCALFLGVAAIIVSQVINFANPSYQATALVASSKTISVVNFGGAITSQSETDLASAAASGAQYLYDRKARLQSYVALVKNGIVAEKVLAQIGPKLPVKQRTTADLLQMVSGSLVSNTDSIRITVTYSDPSIAAEIANAWARAYVQQINELYGDTTAGTSAASIQAQITQSKAAYDSAQKALSDFEAQNKSAEYQRQLDQLTIIVTSLRDSAAAVADQQVQFGISQLKQAYVNKLQIQQFLAAVESMRQAVKTGGDSAAASNALALTMLKTQIYAAFPGSNTLQVQNLPEAMGASISTVNSASMSADLDALTSALTTQETQVDTLIASLSDSIQNGKGLSYVEDLVASSPANAAINARIAESEQKIRDLNSQIGALKARETELTKVQDLAWQSYSALITKGTEMSVAAQTSGSEVIFASLATPPKDKIIRSTVNAFLASLVGLVLGLFSAYFYEFWQRYRSRPIDKIIKIISTYFKGLFHKRFGNSLQKTVEV